MLSSMITLPDISEKEIIPIDNNYRNWIDDGLKRGHPRIGLPNSAVGHLHSVIGTSDLAVGVGSEQVAGPSETSTSIANIDSREAVVDLVTALTGISGMTEASSARRFQQ